MLIFLLGRITQLVECYLDKVKVIGSSPIVTTIYIIPIKNKMKAINSNNIIKKQYLFITFIIFFVCTYTLNAKMPPNDYNVKIEVAKELSILSLDIGDIYTYYGSQQNVHFIETKQSIILIDVLDNKTQMQEVIGYIESLNKSVSCIFLLSNKRDYTQLKTIFKDSIIIANDKVVDKGIFKNAIRAKNGSVNIDGLNIDIKLVDEDMILKLRHYGILIRQDEFGNMYANNQPTSTYKLSPVEKQEYKIILVGKGQNIFLK